MSAPVGAPPSGATVRELAVPGVLEFTPVVHADDRGQFVTEMHEHDLLAALGRPLFPVRQASVSRSRRGVVRGVHFTAGEGTEKYVHCPAGRVLDIVVDLRVGSPAFGTWDVVELDDVGGRALYLPRGVGHAFVALSDGAVMSYLLSTVYVPERELAVSVLDPRLGLPLPADAVLSDRDRAAPTLAEARTAGLLPQGDDPS